MHQITHGVIPATNSNITTSIMIPTYNRINLTKQTLSAINQNTTTPYRLIIVDDGSIDETQSFLKEYQPTNTNCQSYDYYFNQTNQGVGFARNQCLKIATSKYNDPYLSTVDNDVLVYTDWLKQCTDILQANNKFVVGINYEPYQYPVCTMNGVEFRIKPAGNLGTATTVFPRSLFTTIGYFNNKDYPKFGEDDADYHARARKMGYGMGYLKEPGQHLGSGPNDPAEYRAHKDKCHAANLEKFKNNCMRYFNGNLSCYIGFEEWQQI